MELRLHPELQGQVYIDKDPENHKLWFPPNLGIHGLWINTTRKPFDNPALRRAMDMVINRDDIFNIGEAGYFYPKVESVTGIPTPAGESFIAPEFKGKNHKVDVDGGQGGARPPPASSSRATCSRTRPASR